MQSVPSLQGRYVERKEEVVMRSSKFINSELRLLAEPLSDLETVIHLLSLQHDLLMYHMFGVFSPQKPT